MVGWLVDWLVGWLADWLVGVGWLVGRWLAGCRMVMVGLAGQSVGWLVGRLDDQAPVVQRVDNAIHRINHYPADKCWENKLDYPLDSDLSGG